VLDAIMAALGGADQCPDMPIRKGKIKAHVKLDLGEIEVVRKWTPKGSTVEVTAKEGSAIKSPQAVLDKLTGKLTFDPLLFDRMKPAEQAKLLAKIAGLDLDKAAQERAKIYEARKDANRKFDDADKQLKGMPPIAADCPNEEQTVVAFMEELKAIEKEQRSFDKASEELERVKVMQSQVRDTILRIEKELETFRNQSKKLDSQHEELKLEIEKRPVPCDPAPVMEKIKNVENVNRLVRSKNDHAAKESEVKTLRAHRDKLEADLQRFDDANREIVERAKLPVEGLSFDSSLVQFQGIPFAQCSGSERLRVSVAIGLALNPELKLMLIRDGSLLDDNGMELLTELAEKADAQIIIERVDNGKEIGIRIVDGEADSEAVAAAEAVVTA
jgi:hypothetical protein